MDYLGPRVPFLIHGAATTSVSTSRIAFSRCSSQIPEPSSRTASTPGFAKGWKRVNPSAEDLARQADRAADLLSFQEVGQKRRTGIWNRVPTRLPPRLERSVAAPGGQGITSVLRSRRADYLPSLRYASTLRIHCSGSLGLNVDDQSASIIDSPNLRPWTSFSSTGCVEDLLLDEQQIGPHPFCRQSSLATLNRRPASGSTDQFDRVGVLPSAVGEVSFHDQSCVIRWHRSTRCVPCRNRLLNRQPSGNPFRWPPPVIQHPTPRKVRSPLPGTDQCSRRQR